MTTKKIAKKIMRTFYDYAHSKNYTKKIIGAYAFRNKQNKIIRFVSAKNGVVIVWEQDVGRYEVLSEIYLSRLPRQ